MLAVVLAAFVIAVAFVVAALCLSSLHLAALVGTFLGAVLAVGSSADAVCAVVLALMLADLFGSDSVNHLFGSGVIVARSEAESKSSSDESG